MSDDGIRFASFAQLRLLQELVTRLGLEAVCKAGPTLGADDVEQHKQLV